MLADDILTWIDRLRTDPVFRALPENPAHPMVEKALSGAACFVLDDAATEAAQSVSYSYPSSILHAIDQVRLPADNVWIEWPETTRDRIRRQYPDRHYEFDDTETPKRIGLLLQAVPGSRLFTIRCLYGDRDQFNIGFGHMLFDPDREISPALRKEMEVGITPQALAGRNRPGEADAYVSLIGKFSYEIPVHIGEWLGRVVAPMDNPTARLDHLVLQDQRDIASECLFAISLILLLNSRNGLTYEPRDVTKLNRQRIKAGKRPLLDFKITRLAIGRRRRAAMAANIASANGAVVFHWQRAHFKLRKTGVFWWSGHFRGDASLGYKPPRYLVTKTPVGS